VPLRQLLLQMGRAGISNNQAPSASGNDAISIFIREYANSCSYVVSHDTFTNSIVISALILLQIRQEMSNFRLPSPSRWELALLGYQRFGTNDRCHLQKSIIHS
jgi:hypothetical protein